MHSASLSGVCGTVLVPRNKTPTTISSQPAFRETKMSLGISHCCTREEKNNMVFYWRKANNGRKALTTQLGQASKYLFRFPGQKNRISDTSISSNIAEASAQLYRIQPVVQTWLSM